MSRFPENDAKFDMVRALKLPHGQYAITSSGPLGIRGIRLIGDIDMIVTEPLWQTLVQQYGTIIEDGITKIRIGGEIEVLGEGSFLAPRTQHPTVYEQIKEAEIIDRLPFVKLQYIRHFKMILGRPKDLSDIAAIDRLLAGQPA